MKNTIFKKDDRVFCVIYGWGKIIAVDYGSHPITVQFDNNRIITYNSNGCLDANANQSLSFTEYKLDGFSLERPENLPKLGEVVWVKDRDNEDWIVRHFLRKFEVKYLAIEDNPETYIFSEFDLWDKMTTENPYMK